MTRNYNPCEYVVGAFPNEKPCDKPVSVSESRASGTEYMPRCSTHAARLPYWPVN